MENEWMGRYREFVSALIQHSNLNNRSDKIRLKITDDLTLTVNELQVLEYIVLNGNKNDRMMHICKQLGIPQSTFSKIASRLCAYHLLEKKQPADNRKNIILRPTKYAVQVYDDYIANTRANGMFDDFFHILDQLDENTISTMTKAIVALNEKIRLEHDNKSERLSSIPSSPSKSTGAE